MALCGPLISTAHKPFYLQDFYPVKRTQRRTNHKRFGALTLTIVANSEKATKLVTFLGKGGSGKTTASIFAAQHYALLGLKTCLVLQSQDPTAEYLLSCKIGPNPATCGENLSAVRLETTKMILEPLKRLKQADARLNMTQGVLEGIVGEELGVLPGMDSIFSILELERITRLLNVVASASNEKGSFDIVIYDGISSEETIRLIGATSKARLYLKYLRSLAEKTDLGRVAGPSLLRLVGDSLNGANLNNKMSSEIWDYLEKILEKGSSVFGDPQRFGCYLVTDPNKALSANAALRYWGCAIQAGTEISGAFGVSSADFDAEKAENIGTKFSPLPCAFIPRIEFNENIKWDEILASDNSKDARNLLSGSSSNNLTSSVKFDLSDKTVRLFMPGFDKSEIKLYQFRGRSELLIEAGDQRRVIRLPPQVQGKVGGAKFVDRGLVITMR